MRDVTFNQIVDALVRQQVYSRGLEEEVRRLKKCCDDWHEAADPGWRQRELEAALDGEIRLLREQG